LEAEEHLATHQTGHNSGVIHSGLYYKPGSLKARNCAAGRDALYRFCTDNDIAHEKCGKVVVATTQDEIAPLEELERRGRANGLQGLRRLDPDQLREHEPHVQGIAALHVLETGIVDFAQVAETMARQLREAGGEIITGARVRAVRRNGGDFVVETTRGAVKARFLVNCAGLQCDRVARLCGLRPRVRIVPFRGEYYKLVPQRQELVRNLIYPVPDPRFPFLGVHFTRMVHGGVEAGPNAVLAFKREGYGRFSFSPRDTLDTLSYGGFWRMAARHWRTGFGEFYRSFSRAAFVRALQKLLPDLREADVERHGAGVRAQAVAPDGAPLDDFHILEAEHTLHVLNAPSPAATASLSIGSTLARRAAELFGLQMKRIAP
jgi:L-2-hydroxyglutarate oxidase